MSALEAMARELRSLRKGVDKLRAEVRAATESAAPRDGAVKRGVAAKMIGVGLSKLDALVKAGKVATAEDVRLIPLAEVRRYCAPKPKRKHGGGRRPRLVIDETSPEAVAAMKRDLRARRAAP